jgi:hypothetical protein
VNWLDLVQWPAMIVTVAAAWLVASTSKRRRALGFWCFLASNVLWIAWGWHTNAWALIVLQFALAALNLRGVSKNEPQSAQPVSANAPLGAASQVPAPRREVGQ